MATQHKEIFLFLNFVEALYFSIVEIDCCSYHIINHGAKMVRKDYNQL